MRIAIVSPFISTLESIEFYQSQQLNLAVELAKLGVTIDIITAQRQPGDIKRYKAYENVTVYVLPVIARWTNRLFNQLIMVGLWKQLKKEKYDFIQSSEDCLFSTFVSALYVFFKRSRLIIYQGIYEYSTRRVMKAFMRFYDLTAGVILRHVSAMAVCKTQRAKLFLEKKGFKKTCVIPVGVNTELFYSEDRKVNKRLELLAVGNLIPLKNYSLMIDVLYFLTKIRRDVRLTIIGSGPEADDIVRLVKEKNLLSYFRLLEKIPNQDMRFYYSQADLLVLLSRTEIFGMVILEAMACGCPVIATPTPGAVDVIEHGVNGFIIGDMRPEAIASQINNIWSNGATDLENVRSKALQSIAEKYSWGAVAGRYYNIYKIMDYGQNQDGLLS